MAAGNPLDDLATLPPEVLAEVVREAEIMIQAQLTASMASDQRAYTFAGLVLAAATAALSGAVALVRATPPDTELARIAAWYAGSMMAAGGLTIATAWPRRFCVPGNEPKNWHPDEWGVPAGPAQNITRARVEQATVLQSQIRQNAAANKAKAVAQLVGFIIAYGASIICGVALLQVLF